MKRFLINTLIEWAIKMLILMKFIEHTVKAMCFFKNVFTWFRSVTVLEVQFITNKLI